MRLIYGFDPLCGWCFGFVPAMRAVERSFPDLPVTLAMPGLVTGPRVGPYAEMEGYIRSASQRLRDVTGRAPSEAFFDLIRQPGVRGDSTPPIAAITQLASAAPEATLRFAHAVTEAHFETGADLNDHATYTRIATGMGLDVPGFRPRRCTAGSRNDGAGASLRDQQFSDPDHGSGGVPFRHAVPL
jgi:putative protein-disulfide isomerase